MAMFWGNVKFYGTWWVGFFLLCLFAGSSMSGAVASATGSLILPFGFLLIWDAWERVTGPSRGWGHDIDGQDGNN